MAKEYSRNLQEPDLADAYDTVPCRFEPGKRCLHVACCQVEAAKTYAALTKQLIEAMEGLRNREAERG